MKNNTHCQYRRTNTMDLLDAMTFHRGLDTAARELAFEVVKLETLATTGLNFDMCNRRNSFQIH